MTGPRFIAKQDARGLWGVYDRVVGSWPVRRLEVGVVAQNASDEAIAAAEAARLNDHYGSAA